MKLSQEFDNDEDLSLQSDCVLKMESGEQRETELPTSWDM
jgi:hypothetical protein